MNPKAFYEANIYVFLAFIPPMGAIVDDHNPLTGPSDYSDVAELVPDQKATPVVHNVHQ